MLAITEIVLDARDYDSWTNQFSMFATIFGPYWKRLQAYMVRFGIDIAGIFGPLSYKACDHIESP